MISYKGVYHLFLLVVDYLQDGLLSSKLLIFCVNNRLQYQPLHNVSPFYHTKCLQPSHSPLNSSLYCQILFKLPKRLQTFIFLIINLTQPYNFYLPCSVTSHTLFHLLFVCSLLIRQLSVPNFCSYSIEY